jgi:hypothetical protein
MKTNITQTTIALASLLGTVALTAPTPAQAASITTDFTVENLDGVLAGNTFSGNFSYDDSGLTGFDLEELSVSSILFNFQGTQFTDPTDTIVEFFDGEFLGLTFAPVGGDFTFVAGTFDVTDAFFTYDISSGAGFGDVNYETIPTPTLLFGLIPMLGAAIRKKLEME